MHAIELDPGDYRGTYKLVGGRLSLDLVNTVSWPATERKHDWLDSVANLQRWLKAVGLTPAKPCDLSVAIELRELLDAVLRPLAHGRTPPRAAIARLDDRIAAAAAQRGIDPTTLSWRWKKPANTAASLAPVVSGGECFFSGDTVVLALRRGGMRILVGLASSDAWFAMAQ